MNTIETFSNETLGTVRTMTINGDPHFIGKDVAEALGYTNTQKAIRDHVDEEDKLTERIVLSGQNREVIFINESGLYSLILSSKLPAAKEFKRWVTKEVLPAIRKNGGYIDGQEFVPAEEKAELEARIRELHRMVEDYKYNERIQKERIDYLARIIEKDTTGDFDKQDDDEWSDEKLYDLDVEGYTEFQSDMEVFNFSDYHLMEELKSIVTAAQPQYIDTVAAKHIVAEIGRLFVERNAT